MPKSIAFFAGRFIDEVSTALPETPSREPIDGEVNPEGNWRYDVDLGDNGRWSFDESSRKGSSFDGGVSFGFIFWGSFLS